MVAAGPEWAPTGAHPADSTFILLPGLLRLHQEGMLHTLICTITPYLDSQQKWHDFAQQRPQGRLHRLLSCSATSMKLLAKAFSKGSDSQIQAHFKVGMEWYFEFLAQASELSYTHPEAFSANFCNNAVLSSRTFALGGLNMYAPCSLTMPKDVFIGSHAASLPGIFILWMSGASIQCKCGQTNSTFNL